MKNETSQLQEINFLTQIQESQSTAGICRELTSALRLTQQAVHQARESASIEEQLEVVNQRLNFTALQLEKLQNALSH